MPYGSGASAANVMGFQIQGHPQQGLSHMQRQSVQLAANVGLNSMNLSPGTVATQNFLQSHATPAVVSGKPVDGATDWAAYTAPDGRTYYYNSKTGVSSWEKPAAVAGYGH